MMKKILAVLLAVICAFGMLTVMVAAEEIEEPTYEPKVVKIADIIADFEAGKTVTLLPTDIIILGDALPEEGAEPEETGISDVLIVEYVADATAQSENKVSKFADYAETGYAVCGIGDYPTFAYIDGVRKENYSIDFASVNEYAFKQWKVKTIYSGKEFNRVTLVAEWEVPELHGWAGFMELYHGYVKTVIDRILEYFIDFFRRLGEFFI